MTKSQRDDVAAFHAIAHDLADLSAGVILPQFRRQLRVDNKAKGAGFDPVTAADRAAERAISRSLGERLPEHGLEGEEYGTRAGAGRYRWIVDPIDGTRAFILGLPIWGTLIGLMDGATPILGLMNQPYTRERFWSMQKGARFRGPDGRERRIRTRACASLADAMAMTTSPDMFKPGFETERFLSVKAKARATRYGGDCYAYCLLASGHVDLVIEAGLKPFDIAPLIPIIERAGGVVTAWDGSSGAGGGRIVASGDPKLHAQVLKLLR